MTPTSRYLWLPVALAAGLLLLHHQTARRRSLMRRLAAVPDGQDGDLEGLGWWLCLKGRYQGRAADFCQRAGSRSSRTCVEVHLDCRTPLRFHVGWEGVGVRIAKGLHLMKDLELDDPALDEAREVIETSRTLAESVERA
jgi:hypothetical protein